jgi:hypothetical protein
MLQSANIREQTVRNSKRFLTELREDYIRGMLDATYFKIFRYLVCPKGKIYKTRLLPKANNDFFRGVG